MGGPDGLLLNWNNRSAPGFMHGDDEPYGSAQRVELFDKFPAPAQLTDVVGIMNRAATEDVRSPVWPVVSRVLRSGPAPSAREQQIVDLLDDWVRSRRAAPGRRRRPQVRRPGPGDLVDAWRPEARRGGHAPGVRRAARTTSDDVRGLGGQSGHSYVDKDLRTLLGRRVQGEFNLRYCGDGSLRACRESLWAALAEAADELAAEFGGQQDPAKWLRTANRTTFQPGLIPDTFRSTNRPTFQQVLEFQSRYR